MEAPSKTVVKLWSEPRFIGTLWLFTFFVFAGFFFFVLLPRAAVSYGSVIPAIKSDLCPGDNLEYSVTVEITHYPSTATISEGWCRAGDAGSCANSLAKTTTVPLADHRLIKGTPSVPIPISKFFTPGAYEYWHVAVNGKTSGYIVPFTIRADCPVIQPTPAPTK